MIEMDEETMVVLHNEKLYSHKKDWNNILYSNMGEAEGYNPKKSDAGRENLILHVLTYK